METLDEKLVAYSIEEFSDRRGCFLMFKNMLKAKMRNLSCFRLLRTMFSAFHPASTSAIQKTFFFRFAC